MVKIVPVAHQRLGFHLYGRYPVRSGVEGLIGRGGAAVVLAVCLECEGDRRVDSTAGGSAAKVCRDAGGEVGEVAHDVDAADIGLAIGADREAFDTTVTALPDLHALDACLIVETGVGADRKGLHVNRLTGIAGIAQ